MSKNGPCHAEGIRGPAAAAHEKRSWLLIAVVAWLALGGSGMTLPSMDSVTDISIDRLWKEPRDLLVDRVEDARDAQQETIEEFKTAMEKFKAVTGFEGDVNRLIAEMQAAIDEAEAFIRALQV